MIKNSLILLLFIASLAQAAQPVVGTVAQKVGLTASVEYADVKLDQGLKPKVVILLDSSGSMGQLLDKEKSKMFYSKKLFGAYLQDQWREKAAVGLLVYGGRKKMDCKDFYMAVPFGEQSLSKIDSIVKNLGPTGMTPIAASLEMAIDQLKDYPGPKRIMIFTDGEETCHGDPCKVLEKAIQDKVFDLEMYVTGIGMDENSKDLDHLKCLGKTFGAPSPQALASALGDISNEISKSSKSEDGRKNLFVSCPDPMAQVNLYKLENGQRKLVRAFTAAWGIKIPPGDYSAEVQIDPPFIFEKFTVPPKKQVTLKVEGKGVLAVSFFEQLLDVEILNKDKKVVQTSTSDAPIILPSGKYDVRVSGPPFYERYESKFQINPGGKHEIKIDGVGAIQVDYPSNVGIHVYNSSDKVIGNYLTNFPFVLKQGNYRFYVSEKCNIESIEVKNDHAIKHINCSAAKK